VEQFTASAALSDGEVLAERVDALASWLQEMDSRVRAAEIATGDEKTAKELRKAVEAIAKHDTKLAERLTNQVDVLADRVGTLAGTVASATAALGGKDGEIAALRRELAQANERISELDLRARSAQPSGELDELRRAVSRLSAERASTASDKRLEGVEHKIGQLAGRVDTLAATVATTASGLAGREGDVAALRRRLDEEAVRLGAAIAEVKQALDPGAVAELHSTLDRVSQQASAFQREAKSSLVGLGVDLESVTTRLASLDATVAGIGAVTASGREALDTLRGRIDSRDERIASIEARLATLGADHDGRFVAIEATMQSLAGRTDERVAAVEATMQSLAGQADERVASVELRLAETGDRLAALAEQAAAQSAALAALADRPGADEELASLSGRFDAGCAQVDALVRDLQGALDTMPNPEDALELRGRVETLAREVAGLASDLRESSSSEAEETRRLRELVEQHARRLAAGEAELVVLGDSFRALARLDELDRRLETVERRTTEDALQPVAGEGRFRVEMRALELSIEHALTSAREEREAILTQFERLASRVESRLQRLESSEPGVAYAEDGADGRVIPIRTSEA
jgi:chromosome segregation ATPase